MPRAALADGDAAKYLVDVLAASGPGRLTAGGTGNRSTHLLLLVVMVMPGRETTSRVRRWSGPPAAARRTVSRCARSSVCGMCRAPSIIPPATSALGAVQNVGADHSHHGEGILRAAIGRRVGQSAVLRVDVDAEVNLRRTGKVARVLGGVQVEGAEGDARRGKAHAAGPGHRRREGSRAHDRRVQGAGERTSRFRPQDGVGHESARPVRGPGEGDRAASAGDRVGADGGAVPFGCPGNSARTHVAPCWTHTS